MAKKCTKCHVEKDESQFGRNKYKKDGLQTNCKECAILISRSYYSNNREKHKQTVKRYKKKEKLFEKVCTECKTLKEIDQFGKNGKRRQCKECRRIKEKIYDRREVNKKKQFIRSFKDYCIICFEDDPDALDFHHLRDKKINLSNAAERHKSTKSILEEISKCILLCANCHRKYHKKKFCLLVDKNITS